MDLFELDPLAGERNGLFGREEVGLGVCFATDLVIRAMRDEVSITSAPPLVDLPLPKASGSSYVSKPVLLGVEVKTGSVTVGIVPGVLKGLRIILSSSLMKDRRSTGLGVTNVIGLGVELASGVGSSLIRSAVGSSGPVCIVSIRAGCGGVSTLCAWLCSPSNFLTTSSTMVLIGPSLCVATGSATCLLGGEVYSGPVGTSSSLVGSKGPD